MHLRHIIVAYNLDLFTSPDVGIETLGDEVDNEHNLRDKENNSGASNHLEKTETTKDTYFAELDDEILELLNDSKSSTDNGEFMFYPRLTEVWREVLLEGLKK